MFAKIALAVFLTLAVLALPIRLLELKPAFEETLKICKGIIFIGFIIVLMNRDKIFSKTFINKRLSGTVLYKLLPVILLAVGYVAYSINRNSKDLDVSIDRLILSFLAALIAASSEEFVMRGYIFNILFKGKLSLSKSIIATSLIFSLLHLVNIFRYDDVWSVLNQLIFLYFMYIICIFQARLIK